jgi:hypothetical protein
VLPNSPALIHPGRNRAKLQAKRDRLLRRLHEDGRLSAIDLALALREPLPAEPVALPQHAPHLLESLRSQSPGTHRFHTTLDARLQAAATEMVRERGRALARQGIHNAAALIVDNRSFEVLAYVGNANGRWRANAATPIEHRAPAALAPKPPLTALLYAACWTAGEILPGTLVADDAATRYGGYMPENCSRVPGRGQQRGRSSTVSLLDPRCACEATWREPAATIFCASSEMATLFAPPERAQLALRPRAAPGDAVGRRRDVRQYGRYRPPQLGFAPAT